MHNKQDQLKDLKQRMKEDETLPLRSGATQLVFGEGNPDSKLYFLGEAPGYYEDKEGRPFVGQAGKLLNKTLEEIGLSREDIYISNIVRFRPPANRDPEPAEIVAFQPYVDEEIAIVGAPIIVTLGRFSMGKFLSNVKISVVHGQPRRIEWNGKSLVVMPMFHPAAALRSDTVMKEFREDFKKLPKLIEQVEKKDEDTGKSGSGDGGSKKPEQLGLL